MKLILAHSEHERRKKPVCLRGRELDFHVDDRRWQTLFAVYVWDRCSTLNRTLHKSEHHVGCLLSSLQHTSALTYRDMNGDPQTSRDQNRLRGVPVRTDFTVFKWTLFWTDFLFAHITSAVSAPADLFSFLCSVSDKTELQENRFVFPDCFCLLSPPLLMSFFAENRKSVFLIRCSS